MFLISFLLVMASLYYLHLMRVPPRELDARRALATPGEVLAERRFVHYTLGSFVYHIGLNLPVPVFTILFVRHLGLSARWIGALATAATLATALAARPWGRLADRRGNRYALLAALAGLAPTTLLYPLARGPWLLIPVQVVAGIFGSGFGLIVFNQLLECTPSRKRPTFVAVFNSLMMATAFAPLLGVAIYERWGFWGAFWAAAILRAAGWLWLWRFMSPATAVETPRARAALPG